jgi:aminoglycoside phosphotransferase (APT) family kinase protein
MDSARVEAYIAPRLGARKVERVVRSFPGLSRETWLVWFAEGDGVVIRNEPPGGPIVPTSLEQEWKVYEALARTLIPVAKPLWYDSDPELTDGRALFVRDLVDGSTYLPGLYDDTEDAARRRKAVAHEHMQRLSELHLLDWKAAGFGEFMQVPASRADAMRLEFDTWSSLWHEVKIEPFPVVTEALDWLEEHLPAEAAAISLCKGNNGIGEEIWRDDRIVAFSDWELASIGDPCYDWAMSQGMLDLWDRDRILAEYQQVTGFTLSQENFTYYRVWDIFKTACALNSGMRYFISGENTALARATLGFGKVRLFTHLLGEIIRMKTLDEAAEHVLKWRKNPYHDPKISGA